MTLESLAMIFAFAFGAVVGSFLNVVIWRVPRGESIAYPGSHCPRCGAEIRWYQNVPIFSWIFLRGRCAHCGGRIDARYPTIELLTAVLAVACVASFGPSLLAIRAFVLVALLVALTFIDLDHWLLPHAITWPGIVLGVATAWVPLGPGLKDAAIGAAVGFASLWLLQLVATWIFKKEALGGGDVFLFSMIGAFLGWQALLPVIFLASVQGSVVGVAMLALGRRADGTAGEGEAAAPEADEGAASAGEPGPPGETAAEGAHAEAMPPAEGPSEAPPSAPTPEQNEGPAEPSSHETAGEAAAAVPDETDVPAPPAVGGDDAEPEEDDWVPPPTAVPFGPFLSLAALEMLFAGGWLIELFQRFLGLR